MSFYRGRNPYLHEKEVRPPHVSKILSVHPRLTKTYTPAETMILCRIASIQAKVQHGEGIQVGTAYAEISARKLNESTINFPTPSFYRILTNMMFKGLIEQVRITKKVNGLERYSKAFAVIERQTMRLFKLNGWDRPEWVFPDELENIF